VTAGNRAPFSKVPRRSSPEAFSAQFRACTALAACGALVLAESFHGSPPGKGERRWLEPWAGAAETYARQEGERASNAIWRWPGERESAAEFSSTFISEIKCLTARCTKISSSLYNQDECDHGCMAGKRR